MGAHAGRLGAKIVSRGKGHSAVSKAAYNARCTLENERFGTRDDYTRSNNECLFSGIYAPANAPDWTRDREQLWNHVEAFEKRKDSQLARELLIDLAHELTPEQNRWVLQDFIKEHFTRKGLVADLAIHAPHKHSDERNIHAHLMVVFRKLDGTEFEAGKPRQTYAENVAELNGWKRSFEKHMNKALERHGFEPRWDLRSNAERGLDREPEIHLGKAAAALERDGIQTAPGDINREIRERNREREAANENDRGPDPAVDLQAEHELARLEAMAQEFDSRDYSDEAPDYEPVQDLAPEREGNTEDRAAAMAAFEAERAALHRDIAEHNDRVAELDAIREDVRGQFRQQREAFNEAERAAAASERLAEQTRERGDDSASRARNAMEDMARTDPLGAARHFGHHTGDKLKSPEEMRREWADLMRGGVSAERAAENAAAWKKETARPEDLARDPAPDPRRAPAPETTPQLDQVNTQSRDHLVERTAWAERLRGFASEPTPQARREAEPERVQERTREPETLKQAPEIERGGVFEKLRAFVRGWFETKPQPAPQPDRAADRQHEAAGDRQAEHVRPMPAKQPAQTQASQREPEQVRQRPAERARQSIADKWLAEDRAEIKAERDAETPAQKRERAAREADQSRGYGDGGRERTRHHHSALWELFHPWQHHQPRDHHHKP